MHVGEHRCSRIGSDHIVAALKKYLFGDATLQDLPDSPRFVINASNLQSGALWRFMKPYMRDWRVGDRGLAKNSAQVMTLFALANLWMARRSLLAATG